jgi:hypothetical protein
MDNLLKGVYYMTPKMADALFVLVTTRDHGATIRPNTLKALTARGLVESDVFLGKREVWPTSAGWIVGQLLNNAGWKKGGDQ